MIYNNWMEFVGNQYAVTNGSSVCWLSYNMSALVTQHADLIQSWHVAFGAISCHTTFS